MEMTWKYSLSPSAPLPFPVSLSLILLQNVHRLQQMQCQVVLRVFLWQHLNHTVHQTADLLQRHRGTPEITGVLEEKTHTQ